MEKTFTRLELPALRAKMGDWVYYSTFLRMRDLAERVALATEIHPSERLGELMQRQLMESTHAESIREYLTTQPQRFFNSIVVGVYGGSPKWVELELNLEGALGIANVPNHLLGSLGLLVLDGTERLFAIDGQHRVIGITKALRDDPSLGDEEVSAIFLGHRKDQAGLERTRRLFSTLNRYAKPVSKMEIVALDEDDVIAIVTRRLVEKYRLFKNFTSIKRTKGMPSSDHSNLTSIVALYDSMDRYFARNERPWKEFRKVRPSDAAIADFYGRAVDVWDLLLEFFPPLQELVDSDPTQNIAARYRNKEEGGHLLFRPAGLFLMVAAIRHLCDEGKELRSAISALGKVPMALNRYPWDGLLWDSTNHRMMVRGENTKVARQILVFAAGGSLGPLHTDSSKLRREYAGMLNRPLESVRLKKYS